MGIDKRINFVHHFAPPTSLGVLQQHLGRGRSDRPEPGQEKEEPQRAIEATIYWHPDDFVELRGVLRLDVTEVNVQQKQKEERLERMFRFLTDHKTCRREAVLRAGTTGRSNAEEKQGLCEQHFTGYAHCRCDVCYRKKPENASTRPHEVPLTEQVKAALEREPIRGSPPGWMDPARIMPF